MPRYIISDSAARKQAAEIICRRINDRLGYRAADPQYEKTEANRPGAYTGGVVLSERAAAEIADLVDP